MKTNEHYENLKDSYLFVRVGQKTDEYRARNPRADIISLGIGDVTRPLAQAVTDAMHTAVSEMGDAKTFKGYADGRGYPFLRENIRAYYAKKGVELTLDEIFVSDGAKNDLGNFLDIASIDNAVIIPDPVYPVYVDTNIMAGREILYVNGAENNNFLPMPDKSQKAGIIYLCSPNNPTGAAYNKEQLKAWVDYALLNNAIILYDAAYEIFITNDNLPTSIYQIKGAKECAIEFGSFSKTAGFTGVRCGYTIVPFDIPNNLNKLWLRRQTTKHNGVAYIIQKGAAAVFTDAGFKQIKESIAYYANNAAIITKTLKDAGIWYTGGDNSPYVWFKCPGGLSSWEFFDYLLDKANVVGTPGAGFGRNGEGFFRLTAFGDTERIKEAMQRFKGAL